MLCKKPYLIPIPGSRKEERLWENLGAKDVRLSENGIAEIDALLDRMEMPVYGQRREKDRRGCGRKKKSGFEAGGAKRTNRMHSVFPCPFKVKQALYSKGDFTKR